MKMTQQGIRPSNLQKFLPLLFFQLYLWGTVLVFFFGPWPWPVRNPFQLVFFLTVCHFALALGYALSIFWYRIQLKPVRVKPAWIWFVLVFGLFWILPKYWIRLSVISFNPFRFFEMIQTGLSDPLGTYRQFHDSGFGGNASNVLLYLNILFAPIAYAAIPLGLFYWEKLNAFQKTILGIVILGELGTWLARGTNKGVFDFAILSIWMILAGHPGLLRRGKTFKRFLLICFCVFLFIFAGSFFNARHGTLGKQTRAYDPIVRISADYDRPIMQLTPVVLRPLVVMASSYLTAGYYALSLALEKPFVPCYGLGNSFFLTRITRRLFKTDYISDRSYPGRLEAAHGIDRHVRWHTFYTWWASDVSFYGVVLIVFIAGWFLAMTWMDCLLYRHAVSVILFSLTATLVYYLPANNQVFAFSETAIPILFYGFVRMMNRVRG